MFKSIKKGREGQIFSIDLVLSVIIFLILIIFLISVWNLYTTRLNERIATEEIQLLAFEMTDILVETEGVPSNWEENPENVTILGLRNDFKSLDEEKLAAFLLLDYDTIKNKFNIERMEFEFKILEENGSIINTTGISFKNVTEQKTAVRRFVTIGNITRQIVVTLWRKENV